jgi:hypothetical protein
MGGIVCILDTESEVDTFLLFAFLTTSLLLTLLISHYLLTKLTVLFILIWLPLSERLANYIDSKLEAVKTSEYVIILFLLTGFFLGLKLVTLALSIFGEIPLVESTAFVFYDYTLILCSLYFFTSSIYPLIYSHFEEIHLKVKLHLPDIDRANKLSRKKKASIAFILLIISFIILPYPSAGKLLQDIGSLETIVSLKPILVFYSTYFTSIYLAPTNFIFGLFMLVFLYLNPIHSFTDKRLIIALILVSIGALLYFMLQLNCPPSFSHTVTPESAQLWSDNLLEWFLRGFETPEGVNPDTCVPQYNISQ